MTLMPLVAFTLAMSATPGPNNVMVAASAANHGIRPTLPHVFGIAVGFGFMVAVVGLGIGGLLQAAPVVATAMRWIGIAWLLLIAWRLANASSPGQGERRPPMRFLAAASFQWINPKAWLMALSATSAWIRPEQAMLPQLSLIVAIFMLVGLPCMLGWAALGSAASRVLGSPLRLRAFNATMAGLLVISVIPVALGE